MSWNAGRRGFLQVDETRRVGRARGELLLYYTLGSDPALWPAGERRERELIMHDKGYYHSLKEPPPDPTRPTIPKPSFPSPKHPPGDGLALYRAVRGRPTYGECGAISGLLFLAKRSFSASASKF